VNRPDKAHRHHIATDMLSSYLDGQLPARQRALVEAHLQACPVCSEELNTLRYTSSLLKSMPPVRVPRAFTLTEADVGRSAVHSPSRNLSTYLRGASAAVAALLLVVVVGDVIQTTTVRQPPLIASAPRAVVATAVEAPVELAIEKEAVALAEVNAETPIAEGPLAAAAKEQHDTVEETQAAQPQAKLAEEHAVPSESVAAEKAVEVEAVTEKPPEIRALSITPEGEVLGVGGGGQPEGAPLGMGGGGPPEPELLAVAPAIDRAEAAAQSTEQPWALAVAAEEMAAQPAASTANPTAEAVAEVEVEKVVALAATVPAPLPTAETSTPTSEPLPSPEAEAPEATATMAPPVEPRPTPIPLRSPTSPPSEPQDLALGWSTPLRALEISLGSLFVVLLLLSIWFRRR
jgi:hypothetical protein